MCYTFEHVHACAVWFGFLILKVWFFEVKCFISGDRLWFGEMPGFHTVGEEVEWDVGRGVVVRARGRSCVWPG